MSLQRVTHQIVAIPITCAVTTANRTLTQRFRPVVAVELKKKKGNEKQFGCKKKKSPQKIGIKMDMFTDKKK